MDLTLESISSYGTDHLQISLAKRPHDHRSPETMHPTDTFTINNMIDHLKQCGIQVQDPRPAIRKRTENSAIRRHDDIAREKQYRNPISLPSGKSSQYRNGLIMHPDDIKRYAAAGAFPFNTLKQAIFAAKWWSHNPIPKYGCHGPLAKVAHLLPADENEKRSKPIKQCLVCTKVGANPNSPYEHDHPSDYRSFAPGTNKFWVFVSCSRFNPDGTLKTCTTGFPSTSAGDIMLFRDGISTPISHTSSNQYSTWTVWYMNLRARDPELQSIIVKAVDAKEAEDIGWNKLNLDGANSVELVNVETNDVLTYEYHQPQVAVDNSFGDLTEDVTAADILSMDADERGAHCQLLPHSRSIPAVHS